MFVYFKFCVPTSKLFGRMREQSCTFAQMLMSHFDVMFSVPFADMVRHGRIWRNTAAGGLKAFKEAPYS